MIMMVEETWKRLADHYETLIEVAQLGTLRQYLSSGRSPIQGVVFVRQQHFLSKVAAALDERDIRGQDRIQRWLSQGHIRLVNCDEVLANGALDEKNVANDCSCELIYRPPFYVVFLRENPGVVFIPSE